MLLNEDGSIVCFLVNVTKLYLLLATDDRGNQRPTDCHRNDLIHDPAEENKGMIDATIVTALNILKRRHGYHAYLKVDRARSYTAEIISRADIHLVYKIHF